MSGRAVIVVSGGIDSLVTAAIFRTKRKTHYGHALFVDYGQVVAPKEEKAARACARRYGLVLEVVKCSIPFFEHFDILNADVVQYGEQFTQVLDVPPRKHDVRKHIVPMRNVIIMSLAGSLANVVGASEVWVGFDYRRSTPKAIRTQDKSPEFVRYLQWVFNTVSEGVTPEIITPLQKMRKASIVAQGAELGCDFMSTWTCYNNFVRPCGVCAQCATRKNAFEEAGIPDTEYEDVSYVGECLK